MFLTSPHGWVYGVSRKPTLTRQTRRAVNRRLFAKIREGTGRSPVPPVPMISSRYRSETCYVRSSFDRSHHSNSSRASPALRPHVIYEVERVLMPRIGGVMRA